uniref:AAA domain-containing protein, putative AbiEii toxin, Type IV TA system n=1 Tax=Candidatus Kentrum sp. LPFa TaxID=2126335 RepID=A0A450W488_9GAMM|nr:MAG: AAA domain-containing protein, putative AbiEii toxin, Type IV TA system [Candidatus Kentron sp. LPFa]
MQLKSVEYSQFEGTSYEWTLRGLTLRDINLLVGKNASGKSMILAIIHNIALAIAGRHLPLFNHHIIFMLDEDGQETRYEVKGQNNVLVLERFTINGEIKLNRGEGGLGKIHAEKEGKSIEFQTPENQLAIAARRDTLQHPFFEPIHHWADALYYYPFGTPLGKDHLMVLPDGEAPIHGIPVDPKNTSEVVGIFYKGKRDFDDTFMNAVREDFRAVGYAIDEIGLAPPRGIKIGTPFPSKVSAIYAKETDLPGITEQDVISQGMFRALSLIIQINYAVLAGTPSCILIDDIGEGLDFERSVNLIDVLMEKVKGSSVQIIMASNDHFVINHVPLEVCAFVDRQANHVEIRNYENSKEIFDDFEFTGLNNFDFLAFDYLHATETGE